MPHLDDVSRTAKHVLKLLKLLVKLLSFQFLLGHGFVRHVGPERGVQGRIKVKLGELSRLTASCRSTTLEIARFEDVWMDAVLHDALWSPHFAVLPFPWSSYSMCVATEKTRLTLRKAVRTAVSGIPAVVRA